MRDREQQAYEALLTALPTVSKVLLAAVPNAVPLLERFPAVLVQDSTTLALPDALAHLRAYFLGVWREQALQEYLFCVRPRKELALQRFFWRRRIRRAVMTIRRDVVDREAST